MLPPNSSQPRLRVGLSRPVRPAGQHTSFRSLTKVTPVSRVTTKVPSASRPSVKKDARNPEPPSTTTYHAVLYAKRSKKKHKSWLDGYVILTPKRVELQNEDGKKLTSESARGLGGLKEGNTLDLSSWTLEVQNTVAEEDYISGRLFVRQPSVPSCSRPAVKRRMFKPLRPKSHPDKSDSPASMHDPKAKGACILLPASTQNGTVTVDVVLDPYLAKRMRPHQKMGVQFLYKCVQANFFTTGEGGEGAILADEMGLGKSLQAIALMWTLLKQSPTGTPLLRKAIIVCPASLVQNWVNEVKKWLGDERLTPVSLESGNSTFESKQSMATFINGTVKPLLIISYEMFRSYSEQIYNSSCGLVICDEGHRLKSSQGNKTIDALRKLPCRRRVILTGTPVQNDLEEFFAVCDFVNPGCLNSLQSFRTVFANPIILSRDSNAPASVVKLGEARAKELSRISSKFVLRRTSTILERYLPPKRETAIFCRLQHRQESEYEREAQSRFVDYTNTRRFSAALSAINYLRKICTHPDLVRGKNINGYDSDEEPEGSLHRGRGGQGSPLKDFNIQDSSKLQITISLCESSLAVRDKVILVSNFTSTLDLIQEALIRLNISYCRLDGSTAVNSRGDIVRKFNEGRLGDIFLLSAKAGGVGLNLIGANRLILFDPDWNPAVDLQAMARVWRDGQKKNVFVYRLLSTGTIEEKIFQRQLFKGELQSAVDGKYGGNNARQSVASSAGGAGNNESNFSAEQLKDLFQYNRKLEFCETLQVLERSQIDADFVAQLENDDFDMVSKRPTSLLHRFSEYKRFAQSDEGVAGIVPCQGDEVLDNALNGTLNTFGLVSYLYTKKTGCCIAEGEGSAEPNNAKAKVKCNQTANGLVQAKKRKFESMFSSDSDESSEDETLEVLLAMRSKSNKKKEAAVASEVVIVDNSEKSKAEKAPNQTEGDMWENVVNDLIDQEE